MAGRRRAHRAQAALPDARRADAPCGGGGDRSVVSGDAARRRRRLSARLPVRARPSARRPDADGTAGPAEPGRCGDAVVARPRHGSRQGDARDQGLAQGMAQPADPRCRDRHRIPRASARRGRRAARRLARLHRRAPRRCADACGAGGDRLARTSASQRARRRRRRRGDRDRPRPRFAAAAIARGGATVVRSRWSGIRAQGIATVGFRRAAAVADDAQRRPARDRVSGTRRRNGRRGADAARYARSRRRRPRAAASPA